ncbi:MAG: hypothetical protein A2W61_01950 [Deltaproteobacteria bacterium RIFCSPLOWO2_01_44_7]|nr:MAG: hypothetical protein A2712_10745 [Deltaproteobacteria bacterium RIFCSPHIGHO2_01_FULL_43_49]OGQ16532.1 MAG: hypothetical protein A3D22_06445 [Deltaproteobacteria bacterium RIFCSPHIGHO2_02_FULL_44_53]OGQ28349.1 MAG: hypothetical protein A3D98_06150 [Deltaproteobacteria bacterium RIFCSPHIGHO2_12_FULL_44_21]OGQ32420.1 MAG: hypothetical protein A2979_10710 [Deltaproteobacteria bacterium RIFCSPLOWO2_01_FULL_45_74]OGQ38514.1 MAG: hypothetical protein A2W61_01950 [Deltaproteobacteria bacterium 
MVEDVKATAKTIIEKYAEGLSGLTWAECKEAGLEGSQCDALVAALGEGPQGEITKDEREELKRAKLGQEFINELAGKNGLKAVEARAKWLGENAVPRFWGFGKEDRIKIIKEIGRLKPEVAALAIPQLIGLLAENDPEIRKTASESLGQIGKPAQARLLEMLRHENPQVRLAAVEALSMQIDNKVDSKIVDALKQKLHDDDPNVQRATASALKKAGSKAKSALPDLAKALEKTKSDKYLCGEFIDAIRSIDRTSVQAKAAFQEVVNQSIDSLCHGQASVALNPPRKKK